LVLGETSPEGNRKSLFAVHEFLLKTNEKMFIRQLRGIRESFSSFRLDKLDRKLLKRVAVLLAHNSNQLWNSSQIYDRVWQPTCNPIRRNLIQPFGPC